MLLYLCGGGTYICLWVPMYPWVGLLIVLRLLRTALECRYARLWYMAVSTGTVCPVAKGKVTNTYLGFLSNVCAL